MKLEDIKKMPLFEFLDTFKPYRLIAKNSYCYNVNREHWTNSILKEYLYLIEHGKLPEKQKQKKEYKKRDAINFYIVNNEIMDLYDIREYYPHLHISNINASIKKKGHYKTKDRSIYITKKV